MLTLFKNTNKTLYTFLCFILLFNLFIFVSAEEIIQKDNFDLVQLNSRPVSISSTFIPSVIFLDSTSISYKIESFNNLKTLTSLPISFNTSILPTTNVEISSLPVSFSLNTLNKTTTLSSKLVSYSLNTYNKELFKLTSQNISYKTYNGIPVLELVSPNLLPVLKERKLINVIITGNNFVKNSVASIGTLKIQTKYISQNELNATIPEDFLDKENSFELFVNNPPPQGSTSKSFNVMVIEPMPTAKINASPSLGVVPQVVIFNGKDSTDILEKYTGQPSSYLWDFGDNEDNTNNENEDLTLPLTKHKYTKPGKYTVTLAVNNAYGRKNTATQEIDIRDKNESPIAEAIYTLHENEDFLETTFNAEQSQDPESDPITYEWELGDGTKSKEKTLTHKYINKGTYIPKLTVTDSFGASSVKYLGPITYLGPNIPPVSKITISQNIGYLKSIQEAEDFITKFTTHLSAKESYDPDGAILKYRWKIESQDKSEQPIISEEKEFNLELTKAGIFNISLSITDDREKSSETTEKITVLKPDPLASARVDKTSGNAPLVVQFNSNGTRDFDGSTVALQWDFGDGSTSNTETNPTHTYKTPGAYLPTLTVKTKDERIKKINTKTVLVSENNGPVGVISILEPLKLGISNEAKIKLSGKDSYDPQKNQMLLYEWSWIVQEIDRNNNLTDISDIINNQLVNQFNEDFSYTFTTPGQYTPILKIKTEDNRITKINGETITISPNQAPIAIAKIIPNKSTITFDASGSYDPKPNGEIISYLWDFGDGATSNEINPTHTYTRQGTYNAKLTIQDNKGFTSSALTNIIKITTEEEYLKQRINKILDSQEIKERLYKLQTINSSDSLNGISFSKDEEKPNDTTPPQITLSIENPSLKANESLFFNAHITDDIGIETVGYKLIDTNNSTLIEVIEEAPGNNKINDFMSSLDYTKAVLIPEHIKSGKYKLLLFAKDKANNWIGQANSDKLISSEITITNIDSKTTSTLIEGNETNEEHNPDLVKELTETKNLIQIVAASKFTNDPTLNQPLLSKKELTKLNKTIAVNEKQYTTIKQIGTPSVFGAPQTNNIINTISPSISVIMTTSTNTPYINIGVMGSLPSTEKNFSSISINLSGTIANQGSPEVQQYLSIACAPGRDCSIFDESLAKINQPSISLSAIDNSGNQIGEAKTYSLDQGDFSPNEPQEKYAPQIDNISPTQITQGQGALVLTINGSMFNPQTTVIWDTEKLETKYIDNNTLQAFVPAWFTTNSKRIKIKTQKSLDINRQFVESNLKELEILSRTTNQRYFTFETYNDYSTTISGDDLVLQRDGGNVYISNNTTIFKEAGSLTIPFTASHDSTLNLEIIGSLIHNDTFPSINLYHNNKLITSLINNQKCLMLNTNSTCTENQSWKVSLGTLESGAHTIKLLLPDISGQTIFTLDKVKLNFSSNTKPLITSIEPQAISKSNKNDRTLTISGKDFGLNPTIIYKNKQLNTIQINNNKIKVTLPPDLEVLPEQLYINIAVANNQNEKQSDFYAIGLKSEPQISKLNTKYNFISNSLNGPYGKLDVFIEPKETSTIQRTSLIGIFDKDGNIIINPYGIGKISTFNTSFTLAYDLPKGQYHVLALIERMNPNTTTNDYSDLQTKQLLDNLINKNIKDENDFNSRLSKIPKTHYSSFIITDNVSPSLTINNCYMVNDINFIQENQELSINSDLKGNISKDSDIKIILDYGDSEKSFNYEGKSITEKHNYKLEQNTKFKIFEITAIAIKDGVVLGRSNPEIVYVYKDLPPAAIAKANTESNNYSSEAPSKINFTDNSFDPNDELSDFTGAIDKTLSEKNVWELFKYKDGELNQIINKEDLSILNNQVLNNGKTFITGTITNPGTYYAKLTVFDKAGNSDNTQSETIQVTLPNQKLLTHATFDRSTNPTFEYNENGIVTIKFHSLTQVRNNEIPGRIGYLWDFGDGQTSNEINPTHTYIKKTANDRIDYHPELTTTAIWSNGYSESWTSKAGTISIIDKPEFIALDIIPEKIISADLLTISFMISDKSFAKNSTVTNYSFDYGDSSNKEFGNISTLDSEVAALNELKQKTFTHAYTHKGEFYPTLKIKIKENPEKEFLFKSPIISTNGLEINQLKILDPIDNFITNNSLETVQIQIPSSNSFDVVKSLMIHIIDESYNENIVELNPSIIEQTISLAEGKNTYWFELINEDLSTEKTSSKNIILDSISPALYNISITPNELSDSIIVKGNLIENYLEKIEIQTNNETPIILSNNDIQSIDNNEYSFSRSLSNLQNGEQLLTIKVTDYGGNITEESYRIQKGNTKAFLERIPDNSSNSFTSPSTILNSIPYIKNEEKTTVQETVIKGIPFNIKLFTCFTEDTKKSVDDYEAQLNIKDIKLKEIKFNNTTIQKTEEELQGIFNSITKEKKLGCIDIGATLGPTFIKPFCKKNLYTDACKDNCIHLDNAACNIPLLKTNLLNNKTIFASDLSTASTEQLNLTNSWDIGTYELVFEVIENADSCTLYGTCLGKNNDESKTSQTYSYKITVKREPTITTTILSPKELAFDKENEVKLKIIAKDNIPFIESQDKNDNQVPILDLTNTKWLSLTDSQPRPILEVTSSGIDSEDPSKYFFEITTKIQPKILNKIEFEIPVHFPKDYFNPEGINDRVARFSLKTNASFNTDIIYPDDKTIVTDKTIVKSEIARPENLENDLILFNNCKRSTINYGVITNNNSQTITIETKSQSDKTNKKLESLGNKEQSKIIFNNTINFNLKNTESFKNIFLDGSIFGLFELFGEYSTSCNKRSTSYSGKSKKYILLDNILRVKAKCKRLKCRIFKNPE